MIHPIKTIINNKKYKKTVENHKRNILKAYYEMLECDGLEWIMKDPKIMHPLWIRALEHDDSKLYNKEEFKAYRKYYYPVSDKEYKDNLENYEKIKKQHIMNNDHHWQSRSDYTDFTIDTELACLENIMDWLAVGYELHDRPHEYYESIKHIIDLPQKQIDFMEKCIYQGIDKEILDLDKDLDKWLI